MGKRTLFGTDGVRGRANTYPMTADMALKLGAAAGRYFRRDRRNGHRVVIGKDTRLSGYMLEPALTAGFISVGMDVVLFGPLPTPAVGMLTRSLRADLPLDPIRVTLEGVDWHVRVRDLTTLLPINHAPGAQLRRYFELIGVDPAVLDALVDQVLDWRDEDEFVRPFGLESAGYRAAGVAPRNGHFQSPRELLYLPAMTPELYRLIEPHVTAGGDGTVNALLAPDALLASLPGVDDALAERLLDLRRRGELDQDAARSVLAAADEAFDLLRFTPSSVVRIEVAPADGERAEYHGWAAVTPSAVRGPFLEPAGVTGVPKAR